MDTSDKKYSINELSRIKTDINDFILNQDEASRELMFSLRMNTKKINQAIEIIREDIKELDEKDVQTLQEYQNKKMDLMKKHGGKAKSEGDRVFIENYKEIKDSEELQSELEKLNKDYKKIIDTVDQLNEENAQTSNEKVAQIDWNIVLLSDFPETLDDSFSESFLEFIEA